MPKPCPPGRLISREGSHTVPEGFAKYLPLLRGESPTMPNVKTPRRTCVFSCFLVLSLMALLAAPRAAYAQSDEAIDKVTKMNKKAVEEYENLNFEESRKILKDALDYCAQNGLDKHPIKARTHIHLGIVILAGFKQREVAIKQFRKALEIQADIKLTKALANPEVQEAFDEAVAGMGTAEKPDGDKGDKGEKPDKGEKAGAAEGPIVHEAVTEGTQGGAITISAHVDYNLGVKKIVLAYRPDGASEFLGRVMKEVTQGNFSGEIPPSATAGNRVAYYLEAQGPDENTLASKGTADDPLFITLKGAGAPDKNKPSGDEDEDEDEGPSWFLGLGIGSGVGYATGSGEVNADNKITPGFAPATLGQISPEIGYFVHSNLLLSLQLRLQMVTGVNELQLSRDPTAGNAKECGGDFVCSPAKSAFAALAKITYLFGEDKLHPYISAAVGGGQIRHIATFTSVKSCGPTATSKDSCVDTVLAGPVLLGPGLGIIYNASSSFGLTLGINTLLAFPNFSFNIDFNAGVALEF
jgi:tetratricopeptide (TPR) repeat protein